MFRRILIANRGEVAARVLRTARRMGIETVAVTTDADKDLSWLAGATEVVNLGPTRAYLDQGAIIRAGIEHRCSAIHPGWGFLSENPTFAARCEAARLTFIGPRSVTMRRMADKAEARSTMKAAGLGPIPGSEGALHSAEQALAVAEGLGYPVLLKAVSGGGGRGMRRVDEAGAMAGAFAEATAEAAGAFADPRLYLEKLVVAGRHIEFQVLGDGQRVVCLGERECSVQRRHQKLIEETPSPALSREQAAGVGAQVAAACQALSYRGAGTVEMLRDPSGALYFMEMNTRLQVEHTVSEAVTGLDLVEQQLRVAANQRLDLDFESTGHAIQCRINAEDPEQGFRPTPGTVDVLRLPMGEGIRVDTHLAQGDRVSPHYDSMIAKVIAHGKNRLQAIERMKVALKDMKVVGVPTTIPVHLSVLADPDFVAGTYDTSFMERYSS